MWRMSSARIRENLPSARVAISWGSSEAFNRRYVFRSYYDKNAQRIFPVLLDAYGRIIRRATIGSYGERSQLDELAEDIYCGTTDNVFQITLFERGRSLCAQPVISGHISLPVSSIA